LRSFKSKTLIASLLGVASMAVAACGPSTSTSTQGSGSTYSFTYSYKQPTTTGKTVVYGDWQSPDSGNLIVNAFLDATVVDSELDSAIYDGCVVQLPDLSLLNNGYKMSQCKSVTESADGTTTTMNLDPQAKWSDGTPITSKDYRLFYDVFTDDNQIGAEGAPPWDKATVSFPSDTQVVINWHQPYAPYFLNLLGALPSQQYKDAFDSTKFTGGELSATAKDPGYDTTKMAADLNDPKIIDNPIVNGPFMIDSFAPDGSVVSMVPNPNYFSNYFTHKTTLGKLILKSTGDKDVLIQSYKAGQYDHVEDFTIGDMAKFAGIPSNEVLNTPAFSYEHLEYNQQALAPNAKDSGTGTSILADATFRKALNESFNRCAAIESILGVDCNSQAVKTNEFTSNADPAYDANAPFPAYNPNDARQILTAAGYKYDGSKLDYPNTTKQVTLQLYSTSGNPIRASFLQLLQLNWQTNLGINVVVNTVKSNKLFGGYDAGGVLKTGTFDVALFAYSTNGDGDQNTGTLDPSQIPSATNKGGQNEMGINDPKIVDLLNQGRVQLDPVKRIAIYKQLYDYVAQQNYIMPLYIRSDITLTKTTLTNYLQHPTQVGNEWNINDWGQGNANAS